MEGIPWLTQILNRIGKNDDAAAMNTTLFAGQQKIADDIAALPTTAQVNAEVDAALNTAIPGSPTAGSVNDVLKDLDARLPGSGTLSTLAAGDVPPSKTSATTTGVIVEDGTSGTPDVVNVSTHSSNNTFGSWVQMDASASADSWISNVRVATPIDAYGPWVIEIGTGSAGAEATKIRFSFVSYYLGSSGYKKSLVFPLVIPIKVASGTRIAARAAGSGSKTLDVSLSMYQSLE